MSTQFKEIETELNEAVKNKIFKKDVIPREPGGYILVEQIFHIKTENNSTIPTVRLMSNTTGKIHEFSVKLLLG